MYSYVAMEQYEKAIKQCLEILQENNIDEIWYELGNNYMYVNDPIKAIEAYLNVKEETKQLTKNLSIARAYSLIANYHKTIKYLNQCKDKKTNLDVIHGFIESYENLGDKGKAIKYIKKALEIEQKFVVGKSFEPKLNYHLATIYKANNMDNEIAPIKQELLKSTFELAPNFEKKINKL